MERKPEEPKARLQNFNSRKSQVDSWLCGRGMARPAYSRSTSLECRHILLFICKILKNSYVGIEQNQDDKRLS